LLFFLQNPYDLLVDLSPAVHDLIHLMGVDHISERALHKAGDNRIRVEHLELIADRIDHFVCIEQRDVHRDIVGGHGSQLFDQPRPFDHDNRDDCIDKGDLDMPPRLVDVDKPPAS
jgi:hypothetical protein